ncbi:MAG: hypothetical protein B7X37_01375 [Halothiobacillus sp. 14-55-98]|jgi:hypothetical protein|nr:MAG: hypothetical protein B7X37_01375 [Halothiobacillus sp. 14-55-98]
MKFAVLTSSSNHPVKFYDGGDVEKYPLELTFNGHRLNLAVNTLAPECWNWRHYYSDLELNELWPLFGLKFRFLVNEETLVDPALGKPVYFHPFHVEENEISVCYVCDELSNGHFVAWLIGVVVRPIPAQEYSSRIERINKYWHKDG